MKFRMLIKLSLVLVTLISGFNCQLNVMSPYDLTQTMKQLFPSNGSKYLFSFSLSSNFSLYLLKIKNNRH